MAVSAIRDHLSVDTETRHHMVDSQDYTAQGMITGEDGAEEGVSTLRIHGISLKGRFER
jgi:hypothetical protein